MSGDEFDSIGERLRLGPVVVELGKILQWPTAIVFVMLSFSLIYYAGPRLVGRRWHWVTPGSAFGTGLWILAWCVFGRRGCHRVENNRRLLSLEFVHRPDPRASTTSR